jgi:hypothetical protein
MSTTTDIKYIVKVADFGLSRFVEGGKEYYKSNDVAVPIKWTARMYVYMNWLISSLAEALTHNKFSTQSGTQWRV